MRARWRCSVLSREELLIAAIPGDDIGPEVISATVTALNRIAEKFRIEFQFKVTTGVLSTIFEMDG
jgi:isocitrate/isopropylmalate dehydrogenase